MIPAVATELVFHYLGMTVLACPLLLIAILGSFTLIGHPLPEVRISRFTYAAIVIGLLASVTVLILMLMLDTRRVAVELGHWVTLPEEHYHFHLKFVFDRLSVPFVLSAYILCGVVGAFANRYLHREPGYNRFFFLLALFLAGMVITSLAGTIEVLFFGWELVGISSALLVAFLHDRRSPVRNGLRVWATYRISDAALLMAAVVLHHMTGEGDFSGLMGAGSWPEGHAAVTSWQALAVGSLLLIAAAGKSALVPFSGWLPRAMEGPTPSSAVFYGALSVHLGAFLLLRVSPLLDASPVLATLVVIVGLLTAGFAALTSRVQCDVKSALAFASLTQVGIIVAEIGFGLRYLALIHLIGHICLRTLQLLRAPSLLHDYRVLEDAIGRPLEQRSFLDRISMPSNLRLGLYRFALERGYFDTLLDECIVAPAASVLQMCDRWERCWTDWLAGVQSRESQTVEPHAEVVEELLL